MRGDEVIMLDAIYQALLESGALQSTFSTLLTAALTALAAICTYVVATIRAKVEREIEVKNIEQAQKYLSIMDSVIETTVDALNGTVKAELLDKAADGRITKEEGAELLDLAVVTVKAATSAKAQEAIGLLVVDMDEYIRLKIEALLVAQKKEEQRRLMNQEASPVTGTSSIEYEPVKRSN